MSFILDALRKAESLRPQPTPVANADSQFAELAQPVNKPAIRPVWIAAAFAGVVLAAALAIGRSWPTRISTPTVDTTTEPAVTPPLPRDTTEREIRPLDNEVKRGAPTPVATASAESDTTPGRATPGRVTPGTVNISPTPLNADNGVAPAPRVLTNVTVNEQLPSYQALALSGRTTLPPFHLDIHVYSDEASRRFVFVNNRKYREGAQLEEGGSVERITPHGVVLNHLGYRFELRPD